MFQSDVCVVTGELLYLFLPAFLLKWDFGHVLWKITYWAFSSVVNSSLKWAAFPTIFHTKSQIYPNSWIISFSRCCTCEKYLDSQIPEWDILYPCRFLRKIIWSFVTLPFLLFFWPLNVSSLHEHTIKFDGRNFLMLTSKKTTAFTKTFHRKWDI